MDDAIFAAFMVAPDERQEMVAYEIIGRPPSPGPKAAPAPGSAGSFPTPKLRRKIDPIGSRIRYLKPEFISEIAAELESRSIREADKASHGAAPADGT